MEDYTSLKIVRALEFAWIYYPNGLSTGFGISKGYFTFDETDNRLQIVEDGRSKRPKVNLVNITFEDVYMSESEISFADFNELQNTLVTKGCPLSVTTIVSGGGGGENLEQTLINGNNANGREIILSNIAGDIQKIYATAGDIVIESDAYKVHVTANGGLNVTNGVESFNFRYVNPSDSSKYVNVLGSSINGAYNQLLQNKNGTFAYMDDLLAIQEGLSWKQPAKVYITTAISMSGIIPQEVVGTTHQGITINEGDRVILSNQANPVYNGLYRMYLGGGFQRYARTDDANTSSELNNALIPVTDGTFANKTFRQTTPNPTIGTSNIAFSDFGNSVSLATNLVAGIMKMYTVTGTNVDGTMTQKSITDALDLKADKTEITKAYTLLSNISTTSTSAVNTNLSYPIAANEQLKFIADLKLGAVSGGYLIQITVPAGATIQAGSFSAASTTTTVRILNLTANTLSIALQTTSGSTGPVHVPFTVTNSTTAGNVIISFASVAGSLTTMYNGSSIIPFKTIQV